MLSQELPYKRWVGLADPLVAKPLANAVQCGAAGVVLVTTGPTDAEPGDCWGFELEAGYDGRRHFPPGAAGSCSIDD